MAPCLANALALARRRAGPLHDPTRDVGSAGRGPGVGVGRSDHRRRVPCVGESAHGHVSPWFQQALVSGKGRIRAGGVERDIAFEEPRPEVDEDLHAAYHTKYDRYGPSMAQALAQSRTGHQAAPQLGEVELGLEQRPCGCPALSFSVTHGARR